MNRSPAVEKRAFSLHDPLPEQDAGPDTFSRPRGFIDQRSEPRRTVEGRPLLDNAPTGLGVQPGPGTSEYPEVVPQ